MDNNIKRTIIIDNFEHPFNKGLIGNGKLVNANNESCIDGFDIEIKIENNIITDMHFDGEGCAISTSSTSIMLKLLIGKTIDEALSLIEEYENMINEKEYNSELLGEANVYDDTYKQPSRKKCALLPYETIKKYLLKSKKRINSRAIIINNGKLLLFYRKRLVDGVLEEYYSIPGGGLEENESLEECVIRELKEEMNVDIEILGYLGNTESIKGISNFFHAKLVEGIPVLGGEELERNSNTNFYEIQEVPLSEINNIKLYDREMVIKAINKEYKSI